MTMRIGIIAPPWLAVPPIGYGGTEQFVDELARGLRSAGHDVVLFCTGDSTCPVARCWVFDAAHPDRIGDVAFERRHVESAYHVLQDVDVVHDNTMAGPVYALNVPEVPVVVTHHGPFDDQACAAFRTAGQRIALVAISRHQASTAGRLCIEQVIQHGVDLERFPTGPGGDYFVFLGRMTPDKGAHRAAALAREAGVRLLIAGKQREPAEVRYFREHVEPLLGADVEYLGELAPDDKVALLGQARAVLNPIQWPEPFGLVMIEALACGTPVLASPDGAASEIVHDGVTGFLCTSDDEFIRRMNDVGQIDRRACRDAVEHSFSTDRMVRDYERLFRRVATRRSSDGAYGPDQLSELGTRRAL
jgi:glycosyltransferase involved in cell wall biosynthesis